jgi:hypothetical protein
MVPYLDLHDRHYWTEVIAVEESIVVV